MSAAAICIAIAAAYVATAIALGSVIGRAIHNADRHRR